MNKGAKRKRPEDMEEPASKKAKHLVCELCKIVLPSEAFMRQHLLGQQHKKSNSPEEDRKRVEQKCGLFIRGNLPSLSKDAILDYFSKFGKIVWVHFEYSYLFLDYSEPDSAQVVLNKNHYLDGHKLEIRYRQLRKQAQIAARYKEETNQFVQTLKDIPNFDDQLYTIWQNLQPVAHRQFPKYNQVCDDLYKVLRFSFPYCRIHPFGSTITGLGFVNSDVDVFVSGVKSGNNDVSYLYRIKSMLLNSRLFSNVIVIPQAKIPILKCVHIETTINCDVNLRNMLGVCNSGLINYYLDLDPKLRQLMVALKFWARKHRMTGQNHLFTNYSLNLMLIFFLQHPPFNVPPVLELQRDPRFLDDQDGWNGGFQQTAFTSSELHGTSLFKLLVMFFDFYVRFEYGINVVCPYLGSAVKKESFKDPDSLPDYFHGYKRYVGETGQHLRVDSDVCVQDPFEHSRNVTPAVNANILEMFVDHCRLGMKICEEAGPIWYRLLTEVPTDVAPKTNNKSVQTPFAITMRPGLKYIEGKHETVEEKNKAWFESVVKFTRVALEDFLKMNVVEVAASPSKTKHKKTEGQSDVYGEKTQLFFRCKGKLNLWQARKSAAKNNKPDKKGVIEKEKAITEYLSKVYKDVPQVDDIIEFDLSLEHITDPPTVRIDLLKIKAYKSSFKTFIHFFAANLPAWFKTYEHELNEGAGN